MYILSIYDLLWTILYLIWIILCHRYTPLDGVQEKPKSSLEVIRAYAVKTRSYIPAAEGICKRMNLLQKVQG
jgi:hypothetical protein